MKETRDLEGIAQEPIELSQSKSTQKTFYERARSAVSNYLVDVSAGIMFYNPIMATAEHLVAGMDYQEVLKSRSGAIVMQAICMRPIGMTRNASARYWGLTGESHWFKKWASDVSSTLAIQIPTYASVLYLSGASLSEGVKAMAVGVGVIAVSGRVLGKWMDYWRKIWGKTPAIK